MCRLINQSRVPLSVCFASTVQVPSRIDSLRAVALSPTSIQVNWDPPSAPNGPILGYRVLWTESLSNKDQVSTLPTKFLLSFPTRLHQRHGRPFNHAPFSRLTLVVRITAGSYQFCHLPPSLILEMRCVQNVDVNGLNYKMEGLNKFTQYTVSVLAINRFGPGTPSENIITTTQSDGESFTFLFLIYSC